MRLGIFTGARSDYGPIRKLLKKLQENSLISFSLIVGGLHLLKEFGLTIREIEADGFQIDERLSFFNDGITPSHSHFAKAINIISEALLRQKYDALFIVGDRFEAYAAALAAHFTETSIIHSGGGTLTQGAVDNIYRYNITNLASIHLATSKGNYSRLLRLPLPDKNKVFFTGSVAIDAIREFKQAPVPIQKFVSNLQSQNYALITFHPVTNSKEPIAELLQESVEFILQKGMQALVTYPNNDKGYQEIVQTIQTFRGHASVFITENLGATGYYSALNDCLFVLGNSSSGIVEAPYFHKPVINVGIRQEGREKDRGIKDVIANWIDLKKALEFGFRKQWPAVENNNIFGDGNSVRKILHLIEDTKKINSIGKF